MSQNRKKNGASPGPSGPAPTAAKSGQPAGAKLTGWKLWRFRLTAAIGVPLFLLVAVELSLRVFGYGYPTHFFLPLNKNGKELVVQNNQFGWRFFGPAMAREPDAFAFPRVKGPNTVRIFVFGESAAFGDPQSQFGLPRMLQALLELRHPGVKFEVINAAMTGINSNVILPIAEDCARADGDVWVVYMGNNEVVGPYGAGTVFGPQAPPVWTIRASLALKATRVGQVLDAIGRHLHPPPASKSEWGGMEMFLNQQVRADDPRMEKVYANFQRNLADIIKTGTSAGAGVVVSTVAVNLKESAPFASSHRPGLSGTDLDKWNELYREGADFQLKQDWAQAVDRFAQAARIDDSFAELRFRMAMSYAGLTNLAEVQTNFLAARDLDTLRFRCDSRLNDLIRQSVPTNGDGRVLLADAERELAQHSPLGLPGDEYFYEHVHLTFIGNYMLAKSIAPQVEKLLPARIVKPVPADAPWPKGTNCIDRLAWTDWSWQQALSDILERLHDPPFTGQLSHDFEVQNISAKLKGLVNASLMTGLGQLFSQSPLQISFNTCQSAAAAWPDDPHVQEELASVAHELATVRQSAGDTNGAAEVNKLALDAAKRAVDLLPSSAEDWSQLGLFQGEAHQYSEAANSFREAFRLDPEDVWSLYNLGQACEHLNRRQDAADEYQRAVDIKPRFGPAWLALGRVVEAGGDKAKAENCYRLAITNRIHHTPELLMLARFCRERGWFDQSLTIFDEAGRLSPGDKLIPYEAGMMEISRMTNASQLTPKQLDQIRQMASAHFVQAAMVDTNFMQAHFEHGMTAADNAEAAKAFAEAVRIEPQQPIAHLNLGLALERLGRNEEALGQFAETLKLDPKNGLAFEHGQALRKKIGDQNGN